MTAETALSAVLAALEDCRIAALLVGGFSSNYYGVPRATTDADIVIQMPDSSALRALERRLPAGLRLDPQITFETITGNVRHIIRISGSPFVVELFELGDDDFQRQRFGRRRAVQIPGLGPRVYLPTAEDVIVQKLRWGRPKDLDDVRDVLSVQAEALDFDYIEKWATVHGTLPQLEQIRASL